jgi:hypothetical protein
MTELIAGVCERRWGRDERAWPIEFDCILEAFHDWESSRDFWRLA